MIIGISGRISSGKDTTARIIQFLTAKPELKRHWDTWKKWSDPLQGIPPHHPGNVWEVRRFAAKLKEICSILTGIPVEDFEKQEIKDSLMPECWRKFGEKYLLPGDIIKSTGGYDLTLEEGFFVMFDSEWGWELYHKGDEGPYCSIRTIVKQQGFLPTYRWLLQNMGTEAMREIIHENVWVNALFADYKRSPTTIEGILNRGVDPRLPEYKASLYPKWIISDMRFPNELSAIKEREGITIRVTRPGTDVGSTHPSETSLDDATFDYEINNDSSLQDLVKKVQEILIKEKIIS